jgi:hypothetical protein
VHQTCKDCQPAPEIPEGTITATLAQYGDIKAIEDEKWAKAYRYAVANGNRIVKIAFEMHMRSHVTIAGS